MQAFKTIIFIDEFYLYLFYNMELTQKQRNILNFITEFTIGNSYPPTYSEISSEFDISTTTVQEHIGALIRKGCIEKSGGIARGFIVKNKSVSEFSKAKNNVKLVPIIGHVSAGHPVLAYENIQGYISYDSKRRTIKNLFALCVKGDSMINAGIFENDIVIARPQKGAEDGEIVIALLGNEATVKRLKKDKDGYYLMPENNNYEPIRQEFDVLGKVIALKRTGVI